METDERTPLLALDGGGNHESQREEEEVYSITRKNEEEEEEVNVVEEEVEPLHQPPSTLTEAEGGVINANFPQNPSRHSFPAATPSCRPRPSSRPFQLRNNIQSLFLPLSTPFSWMDSSDSQSRWTASLFPKSSENYEDAADEGLYEEGNGLRAWYGDYTTIDWIHDCVKERVRMRQLRSIEGLRGWIAKTVDSLQAWILILVIGTLSGCLASGISVSEIWINDLRGGFCRKGFLRSKRFCCFTPDTTLPATCDSWTTWPSFFENVPSPAPADWIPSFVFILSAITLAGLSCLLALLSRGHSKAGDALGFFHAAGSGVPEVKTILGGFVIRGFLGLKTLVIKSIALVFAVSSGLCIGQQGPLVHIACCIGNISTRFFRKYTKNEAKKREMLSAAAAAGVSVAFGAPIGGVLFSLEEVSYYFPSKTMWRSFFCALIAAVTLKLINPFGTGKLVMFQVTYDHDWQTFEMVPFLLLGLFGGVYGAVFIRASNIVAKLRKAILRYVSPLILVLVVAAFTAYISYASWINRMGLNELVGVLFSECKDENDLHGLCRKSEISSTISLIGSTLILKVVLILLTFGIAVPSGIFIPSMVVGACFGRIIGLVMLQINMAYPSLWVFSNCPKDRDCVTPAVYAMVGAAAALTGVTRMTVSLVIIMVELTGALTYVLPIMSAIMTAKWSADLLCRESIYDTMIKRFGYPYLDHKHEHHPKTGLVRASMMAGDVAEPPITDANGEYSDCFQINTQYSGIDIESKIKKSVQVRWSEDGGFAVLDKHILIGYIAHNELKYAWGQVPSNNTEQYQCYFRRNTNNESYLDESPLNGFDLTPWMDQAPIMVSSQTSMELVTEMFVKLGVKTICVVQNNGAFVGLIHKKRLLTWLSE